MPRPFADAARHPRKVTVFVETEVWERFLQTARKRGVRERRDVTASMLLREAMREYLKKHRKGG